MNEYEDANITFSAHSYSGIAEIDYQGKKTVVDLYSEQGNIYTYHIEGKPIVSISKRQAIKLAGMFAMCFALSMLILNCNRFLNINKIINNTKLLLIIPIIITTFFNIGFSYFISIATILIAMLAMPGVEKHILKYKTRKNITLFICITFIITFMIIAKPLFMNLPNDPTNINIKNMSIAIFSLFIVAYFEIVLLLVYNRLCTILIKDEDKKNTIKKRYFWYLFATTLAILTVWGIAFYPANMSSDSVSQWLQATDHNAILHDNHPVIMVLIIRGLSVLSTNPHTYIILQNVLLALTSSLILFDLYKKGFKMRYLLLVAIIVPSMPNIGINNTTVWKDVIYSISILGMTYITYKIVEEKDFFDKKYNYLLFLLYMVLISQFRHNGVIPWMLLTITYFIISIKRKSKSLFIITVISFLIIIFMKGPMLKILHVADSGLSGSKYNSIIKNFGATLYYGGNLTEDAQEAIKDIMTKEEFIEHYNPINIDYYFYWSENSVQNWFDVANNYKMQDIIPLYLKNILKYPGIFLRDRFDSMAIMISISNHKSIDQMAVYFDGIYKHGELTKEALALYIDNSFEYSDVYLANNFISNKLLRPYLRICSDTGYLRILLIKPGLYLAILILLIYNIIIEKKYGKLLMFIPIIANTLSWVIVLNHPSIRYVYYINLCAIYLIMLSCTKGGKNKGNNG